MKKPEPTREWADKDLRLLTELLRRKGQARTDCDFDLEASLKRQIADLKAVYGE